MSAGPPNALPPGLRQLRHAVAVFEGSRRWWIRHLPALVVIATMGVLLTTAAPRRSPTMDERFHTTRGLAFWWKGDPRLSLTHPPLGNAITAAPGALVLPRADFGTMLGWEDADLYEVSTHWFVNDYPAARRALMWCRAAMCALTVGFAAYFYLSALSLFGWRVAICSLVLLAFNPTILANGALMTTDLPVTFGAFAMIVEFVRYLKSGRYRNLVVFGLVTGVAMMAKHTAFGVFALLTAIWIGFAVFGKEYAGRRGARKVLRLAGDLAIVAVLVLAAINVSYRFDRTGMTVERILAQKEPEDHTTRTPLSSSALAKLPPGLPIPVPYTLIYGLHAVSEHALTGHSTWYWGEHGREGWPSYFPVLLSIKTPVPVLVMLLAAMVVGLSPPLRRPDKILSVFILVSIAYFALLVRSKLNIGVRHALPLVPLITLFAGMGAVALLRRAASTEGNKRLGLLLLPAACLGVMPIVPLTTFPDYLGYFNAIVGRERGHTISIVAEDWGQDTIDLAELAKKKRLKPLYHSAYVPEGDLELRFLGVSAQRLDCKETPLEKAWIAVHVNAIVRTPDCFPWQDRAKLKYTLHDHIRVYRFNPKAKKRRKTADDDD